MKRFLIVAAFPYIDGAKHLGNLAGSMLPADIQARFRRLQGAEVLFLCGTDEHGSTAELAAIAADEEIGSYCDRQHELQSRTYRDFMLSFDWFGRTSGAETRNVAQEICGQLEKRGWIEERLADCLYSRRDGRLLSDRLVGGICPRCGYERARGDQCESCLSPLEAENLSRPVSTLSGSSDFELRRTPHLYLCLSRMQPQLEDWISTRSGWSDPAVTAVRQYLDAGVEDIAITRDLAWGAPVKRAGQVRLGYEQKVFYFWFDAPLGPIGVTRDWGRATGGDWRRWWRADQGAEDVIHIQFVGKDNVAFLVGLHTGALIGTGEPWKRIDRLKAFGWLTWYGGKFSSRDRRGIFMDEALAILPGDCWRWCLTAEAPEQGDAAFTLERLRELVNRDLAGTLNGLVAGVDTLCRHAGGKVPVGGRSGRREARLLDELDAVISSLTRALGNLEYRAAAAQLRAIWNIGRTYVDEALALSDDDPHRIAVRVRTALNLLNLIGVVSQPFIPGAAGALHDGLPAPLSGRGWPRRRDGKLLDRLPRGAAVHLPERLFDPIGRDQVAAWSKEFAGVASRRPEPVGLSEPGKEA